MSKIKNSFQFITFFRKTSLINNHLRGLLPATPTPASLIAPSPAPRPAFSTENSNYALGKYFSANF
jgi:hypothetical protein